MSIDGRGKLVRCLGLSDGFISGVCGVVSGDVFFFVAEGGIRYLVRSRGLGEGVYGQV